MAHQCYGSFLMTKRIECPQDYEFKAILELMMCSDPFPLEGGSNGSKYLYVTGYLNYISEQMGYKDWIDAYHKIK